MTKPGWHSILVRDITYEHLKVVMKEEGLTTMGQAVDYMIAERAK